MGGYSIQKSSMVRWENVVLEFSFKGNHLTNTEVRFYRCVSCYKLSKKTTSGERYPVAHLTVRNVIMVTNPDHPSTPHCCHPETDMLAAKVLAAKVLAKRFMTQV